jgi:hypothetical protein
MKLTGQKLTMSEDPLLKDESLLWGMYFQCRDGGKLLFQKACAKFHFQDIGVVRCCLELRTDLNMYELVEQKKAFNLLTEVKASHEEVFLASPRYIIIKVLLNPNLISLFKAAQTAEGAMKLFAKMIQRQSDIEKLDYENIHPLLQAENWYCLSVKQQQGDKEVGFETFWNYVNPALLNNPETTSDQISEGIVNFVKYWTEANLAEATQTATAQLLKGISDTFGELLDGALEGLEDDEVGDTLLGNLTDFFEAEEWPFAKVSGATALRLSFRGDSGQWNCYAKANEAQQTVLFYSICPLAAEPEVLGLISEFLTRANYGMVIGNFELDYSDGEIRYKTSIDVEGDRLTYALIKQLVYTNILTMDQYLPGILAVLEQNITPEQAILRVEQGETFESES